MVWPPVGKKSLICLAVSIECQNVTDGRTDRQMDRQTYCMSTVRTYAEHSNVKMTWF